MRHLTTRPGVILALSFVIVLLIPLWAALGFFQSPAEAEEGEGHGGGMAMAREAAIKEFVAQAQAFLVSNTRPDGCVDPTYAQPVEDVVEADGHEATLAQHEEDHEENPVVYLRAMQFGYFPPKLCLKAGQAYTFKMMATDVTHGASIQLGDASYMVRLPPGVEVEQQVVFTKPGEYLIYCSYYCGVGHPFMKARIIVEPAEGEM
ncbi:cupredoxin domain-containing protein [Marinithermus hydrothermalis]|uniref:Cytochrome c oxidase subunit II n=1 Tax=Marinithermus hydrothermalis (strain DSM 14884 / JCM 11576 / T1) TaxID=869210 RepID=F2NPF6_MARHT|nr:cupredoxin domain-containing protein [Marinithermus hydrothermalis]AEB12237.1 cytochrome c oxidase subunit II [Marinithermus hydrothermalis DSM 14884]